MVEDIPRVIIPDNFQKIKRFIQLYLDGKSSIKFGPFTHNYLLLDFLNDFKLDYQFREGNNNYPELIGKHYNAVGMGYSFVNGESKLVIDKNSQSQGYHIGFNEEHFEEVRPFFPKNLEVEFI